MGIKITGVIHPRTRKTSSATETKDGLWEFPDGIAVSEDKLSDSDGRETTLILLVSFAWLAWFAWHYFIR